MTLTEAPPSSRSLDAAPAVWRTYGGGALLLGGAVLLVATVIEWAYSAGGMTDSALFAAYALTFVFALSVLAVATVPLALGSNGRNGIVAASAVGRIALIGYSSFFLAAQAMLLVARFALDDEGAIATAMTTHLVFTAVQTAAAVAAAVVIVRAGVARGLARWTFPASVVIGIAAGALSNAAPSLEAVMLGFCLSAASIAVAGLSFLVGASRSETAASA